MARNYDNWADGYSDGHRYHMDGDLEAKDNHRYWTDDDYANGFDTAGADS